LTPRRVRAITLIRLDFWYLELDDGKYVKPDVCGIKYGPRSEAAVSLEKKRDQKEEEKKLEKVINGNMQRK